MKIASTIARYLLAFVFIVFGLNGFLHFIPQPPPPSEMAGQYFTVMFFSSPKHNPIALDNLHSRESEFRLNVLKELRSHSNRHRSIKPEVFIEILEV